MSPLIADPFLSETGCGNHTGNSTEIVHHFRSLLRNSPIAQHNISDSHSSAEPGEEDSNVHYAFWIMALINVRQAASLLPYSSLVFNSKANNVNIPQLPVPITVLFLMYREQLIPCCPSGTPRLLDKDELAMEKHQGAEAPDVEQSDHSAGGKNVSEAAIRCRSLTVTRRSSATPV